MKNALLVCLAGTLGLIVLLFVLRDSEWTCAAGVEFNRSGVRESMAGGFLSYSEVDLGSAKSRSDNSYSVNLRGNHDFRFRYSDNIANVRLSFGSNQIYGGLPIAAFDARENKSKAPLTIKLQGAGNDFSVNVSDKCSIGSFIASF